MFFEDSFYIKRNKSTEESKVQFYRTKTTLERTSRKRLDRLYLQDKKPTSKDCLKDKEYTR
jgi:hypothetical protein